MDYENKAENNCFRICFCVCLCRCLCAHAFMDFFASSFVLPYVASDDDQALQVLLIHKLAGLRNSSVKAHTVSPKLIV